MKMKKTNGKFEIGSINWDLKLEFKIVA